MDITERMLFNGALECLISENNRIEWSAGVLGRLHFLRVVGDRSIDYYIAAVVLTDTFI